MTLTPVAPRRRRCRHRRRGLRGRAARAGAAAARPARRAARARPASAVRHRRVVDAARRPADRGTRRPLRSAAPPRLLEVGHVAGRRIPRWPAASSAASASSSTSRDRRSRTTTRTRDSCSSPRARTTRSPTRTGIVPTSITGWCGRPRRRGRCYLDDAALDAPTFDQGHPVIEGTRRGPPVPRRRVVPRRCQRTARVPVAHASASATRRTRGCRRRRRCTRTSRSVAALGRTASPPTRRRRIRSTTRRVHHVLPGAWMWVLRFNNGLTSAGVAATDAVARRYALHDGAAGVGRGCSPTTRRCARSSPARTATRPFVHTPRVAHRTRGRRGADWALLPSAAGVVDPLLSTGFPLTLLGIARLAASPRGDRARCRTRRRHSSDYAHDTIEELARHRAARRGALRDDDGLPAVQAPHAALLRGGQLRRDRPAPRPAGACARLPAARRSATSARRCAASSTRALTLAGGAGERRGRARACSTTSPQAIAPFDVAGLGDTTRRDWYPVLASDLHAARARLGVTPQAIDALLARCGFGADDAATRLAVACAGRCGA